MMQLWGMLCVRVGEEEAEAPISNFKTRNEFLLTFSRRAKPRIFANTPSSSNARNLYIRVADASLVIISVSSVRFFFSLEFLINIHNGHMACKEAQFDVVEQIVNSQFEAFSINPNAQQSTCQ